MADTSKANDNEQGKVSYTQILRNRFLAYLWLGQLVSRSGDFVFDVAVVWLVLKLTGSALNVGITVGVTLLPAVLVAPFSGVCVDRFNRRWLLRISNGVQAVICVLIAFAYATGFTSFPLFLLLLFALNAAGQFTGGAVTAMLPRVVKPSELAAANGLFSVSTSFNQLLAYGIGGIAILALGIDVPIFYDALTFIFALAMISLVPSSFGTPSLEQTGSKGKSFLESFTEGLSYIRNNKVLLEIVALAVAVNFFGGAVGALLAPYAKIVLGGGPTSYGFLLSSFSLGALAGALVTGRINVRDNVGTILFGGLAASGALVITLGLVTTLWLALVIAVAVGFFEAAINLPIQVLVQAKIPGAILGRTIGTLGALVSATVPLASFSSGGLAIILSIPLTFEIFGLMLVAATIISFSVFGELRSAKY